MTRDQQDSAWLAAAVALLAAFVLAGWLVVAMLLSGCTILDVVVPDNDACIETCLPRCRSSPAVLVPSRCYELCQTQCEGGG